jgi:perosamine synthetase
MFTIRLKDNKTRDDLKDFLSKNKISCKVYFDPIHLTPFYREKFKYQTGFLPVTEKIAGEILTLPMFPELKEEEIDFIAEKFKEFFNKKESPHPKERGIN